MAPRKASASSLSAPSTSLVPASQARPVQPRPIGGSMLEEGKATAQEQIKALVRVLAPNETWLKLKVGSLGVARRPEAEAALVAVRELKDTAEKGRKMLTKPLLDRKKEIDGVYSAFVEEAGQIDAHIWKLIQCSREEERLALMKAAEKEARTAEKKGATQLAEDIRQQASEAPALSLLNTQTVVRGEVVDLMALIKAVAEGKAPLDCLQPNQAAISRLVKSGLSLPGVKRVEEEIGKRSA